MSTGKIMPTVGEWIRVDSGELPAIDDKYEHNESVLVLIVDIYGFRSLGWYDFNINIWYEIKSDSYGDAYQAQPTHFMYLPANPAD